MYAKRPPKDLARRCSRDSRERRRTTGVPRCLLTSSSARPTLLTKNALIVAERSSVADASPVSGEELKRAEEFARESFVLDGEDAATALADDSARSRSSAGPTPPC